MIIQRIIVRTIKYINKQQFQQIARTQYESLRLISTSRHLCGEKHFTDKHEWVEINGKIGTVGISQYAQEALGDVVFAQLPEVDTQLGKGDECGALESVKAASEIYSPVSGKVTAKNANVEDSPSLINTSCYENGWLYKIELKDLSELKGLMTEDKYNEYIKTTSDSH